MSEHPDPILEKLRAFVAGDDPTITRTHLKHFLDLFDHQEAQLAALRKLKTPATTAATPPPPDETICQEADRLVSTDRNEAYGHPREDMSRTATMWEAILGVQPGWIGPEKVAMCMIAVKLSRLCHAYKRDTAVDIAGYAKCIDLIDQAKP